VEVRVLTPRDDSARGGSASPPVLPAAPPPVAVVNAPAVRAPADAMFIQAGVFSTHENARRRVEQLLAAGVELASLDELARNDRVLHRVRVGPFATVEEFDLNMTRLRGLGIADARLLID
jgi:rare lipoprotein A